MRYYKVFLHRLLNKWASVYFELGEAFVNFSSYIKNINSVTNVSITIALNKQSLIILRLTGILLYVVCT